MFVPVFEPTKVLFAGKDYKNIMRSKGSGHATYLKEVKIKQI